MRIFLRGLYNLFNVGDDLIVAANLAFLERNIGLSNSDSFIYLQSREKSFFRLNYKTSLNIRYGIDINHLITVLNSYMKQCKIFKPMRRLCIVFFITILIVNVFVYKIFKINYFFKDFIAFYENLHIIHYIGGGYITDRWKLLMVLELLNIYIARLINRNIFIIGTGLGIGPFRWGISLIFLKLLLSRFDFIFLREDESLLLVKTLMPKSNAKCCGDDVLLLWPELKSITKECFSRNVIAFNLKDFPDHSYEIISKQLMKYFSYIRRQSLQVEFFSFGQWPGPEDQQLLEINAELKKMVSSTHDPYVDGFYKFLSNLCTVRLGIGFAYHFTTILAILSIPCIAIYQGNYYKQKVSGAMKLMKMPHALSVDEFIKSQKLLMSENIFKRIGNNEVIEELYGSMLEAYSEAYHQILEKINIRCT